MLGLRNHFKGLVQCGGHPETSLCARTGGFLSYLVIVSFPLCVFHLPLQSFSFQFYKAASHGDHTEIPVNQLAAQLPPYPGRTAQRLSAPLHGSCSAWGRERSGDNTSPGPESRGIDPAASHVLDRHASLRNPPQL